MVWLNLLVYSVLALVCLSLVGIGLWRVKLPIWSMLGLLMITMAAIAELNISIVAFYDNFHSRLFVANYAAVRLFFGIGASIVIINKLICEYRIRKHLTDHHSELASTNEKLKQI